MNPEAVWRMKEPCSECPFADDESVQLWSTEIFCPDRWKKLRADLLHGLHFVCHKTDSRSGDGSNLVCAGAIRWQAEQGVVADYVQICERLEIIRSRANGA